MVGSFWPGAVIGQNTQPQPGIKAKPPGQCLTVLRSGALAKLHILMMPQPKPHHKLPLMTVAAQVPGQALTRLVHVIDKWPLKAINPLDHSHLR